jgi:hypothetical protein
MGATTHAMPRRGVFIVAFIVLALALASLFVLERTSTGASTVSHISSIPASAHHAARPSNNGNKDKSDDGEKHHRKPRRCDDDNKDRKRNCRPPSGKPKNDE